MRKKNHMTLVYQGTQHNTKKWKNLNFLLNGQNHLFESFSISWWCNLSNNFNLTLSKLLFQWKKDQFRYFVVKIIFQALSLEIKPLKSTLSTQGENPKIPITQKALNRIL